jgi:hypothetical protein
MGQIISNPALLPKPYRARLPGLWATKCTLGDKLGDDIGRESLVGPYPSDRASRLVLLARSYRRQPRRLGGYANVDIAPLAATAPFPSLIFLHSLLLSTH